MIKLSLGSTDRLPHDQVMVRARFLTPDSNWTWFATEFDGEDTFLGLVMGFEMELGYWSLSELETTLQIPCRRRLRTAATFDRR